MFLKSELIENRNIIVEGFKKELLGSISHDLTIEKMIISENLVEESFELQPQKTIFIQCDQAIKLPSDLLGIVHGKNSRIRQGLEISSPIYQPGHHTKIFFRITNISSDVIILKKGNAIAQISFVEVKGAGADYNGEFQNEFQYKGLGKYDNSYLSRKLEDKIEKLEEIERKIYAGVAVIITTMIAIFGFFNTGIKLGEGTSIAEVFSFMSLGLVGLVTLLFSIIGFLFSKKTWVSTVCAVVSLIAFGILFFLTWGN